MIKNTLILGTMLTLLSSLSSANALEISKSEIDTNFLMIDDW